MTPPREPQPIVLTRDTRQGRLLVPILVFIALLASIVSSLGAPLVPTIAEVYGVSVGSAQWSLTITLLVGAVAAPVVGRLGDGPRRVQVLLCALGLFVTGSVVAALPAGFAVLLTGRGLQGVGMALVPVALSVVRDHLEPERARTALATLSVTPVAGLGLGYPLTGVIAEHMSFHAGFWLAAGLGLVAMLLAVLVVPNSGHRHPRPFDLIGALLLTLGVAGVVVCIGEGSAWGWGSTRWWSILAAAVVTLIVWGRHELRTPAPLVELRLMTGSTVMTANACALLAGIGMYALMAMSVRYVQTPTVVDYGLGASVVVAGLALVPMSVGSFVASSGASLLSKWIRPAVILPFGVLVFAAGCLFFAFERRELWQIFVVMGLVGLGTGFSFAVMPRMIVAAVPARETGSAVAVNQILRNIGYSIGSAFSATLLTTLTIAPSAYPTDHGFTVGALMAAGMCLVAAVVAGILAARSPRSPDAPPSGRTLLLEAAR